MVTRRQQNERDEAVVQRRVERLVRTLEEAVQRRERDLDAQDVVLLEKRALTEAARQGSAAVRDHGRGAAPRRHRLQRWLAAHVPGRRPTRSRKTP